MAPRRTATRQGYLCDKAHFPALCIFMSHAGEVVENRGAVGDLWVGGGVDAPAGHTPPSVIDSAASPLCLARAFCSAAALKCIDFRQPFRLLVDLIS